MNANSGYNGYSMSNRAVEAYLNGEKPLSKWTKAEIISAVSELDPVKAELLRSVKLSALKEKALYCSSWHHTSSMYNETKFYCIDEDFIDGLTEEEEREKAAAERERHIRERSSAAALEFYDSIKDDCSYSNSGHIYKKGRKPSSYDYEEGLDKFFTKGEHRLYRGFTTGILHLETWNGTEWISEED